MYIASRGKKFTNTSASGKSVVVALGSVREVVTLGPGQSLDLDKGKYAGAQVFEEVEYFKSSDEILKNSVIFDIETLGKGTGSIHEMALYKVGENELLVSTLKPQLVQRETGSDAYNMRRQSLMQFTDVSEYIKSRGGLVENLTHADNAILSFLKEEAIVKNIAEQYRGQKNLPKHIQSIIQAADTPDLLERQFVLSKHVPAIRANIDKIKITPEETLLQTYEKQEDYLVRYIIPQSERYQQFAKEHPHIQKVLGYLLDSKDVSAVSESGIKQFLTESFPDKADTISDMKIDVKHNQRASEAFENFATAMQGKVVFIANAAFESKQIGSYIDAATNIAIEKKLGKTDSEQIASTTKYLEKNKIPVNDINIKNYREMIKSNIKKEVNPFYKSGIATAVQTGESFYITGKEFNLARSIAFQTGDFSNLFQAFTQHTRSGDVRDIQDIIRSQQAMLGKMNVMAYERPLALSMEVQGRIYSALEKITPDMDLFKTSNVRSVIEALSSKETHIAAGDTGISEAVVLRESLSQSAAINQYMRGSYSQRKEMMKTAGVNSPLLKGILYGKMMEQMQSNGVFEELFKQRAGSFLEQMATVGQATRALRFDESPPNIKTKLQEKNVTLAGPKDTPVKDMVLTESIPVSRAKQLKMINYSEVRSDLLSTIDYPGLDTKKVVGEIEDTLLSKGILRKYSGGNIEFDSEALTKGSQKNLELIEFAKEKQKAYSGQIAGIERMQSTMNLPNMIHQAKMFLQGYEKFGKRVPIPEVPDSPIITKPTIPSLVNSVNDKIIAATTQEEAFSALDTELKMYSRAMYDDSSFGKMFNKNNMKYFGMYAVTGLALTAIGAVGDYAKSKPSSSILAPSYDTWYDNQSKFFGNENSFLDALSTDSENIEGMRETGIAAMLRKTGTDFGSPYQGPEYSNYVLNDNELRHARRKYMTESFTKNNFSTGGSINDLIKKLTNNLEGSGVVNFDPSTKEFFSDFVPVDQASMPYVKSSNFMQLDLSKGYQLSVEDADTITIKREGMGTELEQFMGSRPSFKFRLAGIDAPETAHGDREAQPYAYESKKVLESILSNSKDLRIMVNPAESTYGRQVAMLYSGNQNINLEMIRQGAVMHLPYRTGKEQIWDDEAFGKAQMQASTGVKGIFASSYWQAYADFRKQTGESVTFNTLANVNKVAENANLMSLYSIMNTSQKIGRYDVYMQQEMQALKEKMRAQTYKDGIKEFRALDTDYKGNEYNSLTYFGGSNPSLYKYHDAEVKADLTHLMRSRNSKISIDKFKASNLKENDMKLSKSELNPRNHGFSDTHLYSLYKTPRAKIHRRNQDIEYLQQATLNETMQTSPIGHYRM